MHNMFYVLNTEGVADSMYIFKLETLELFNCALERSNFENFDRVLEVLDSSLRYTDTYRIQV